MAGSALVRKSFTLRDDLVREAEGIAGPRGMSQYVNRALETQLRVDRLTDYIETTEAELGPVPGEVMQSVANDIAAANAASGYGA